jgi:type II secretory pathway pseudopilin PulG
MLLKKAAMFGLDARIALAIFGALSVISGAALYSAIQEAKLTKVLVEVNEVGKAVEQYILDTGLNLLVYGGTGLTLDPQALLEDPGVTGWNGPYLSGEMRSGYPANLLLDGSDTSYFKIKKATNVTWTAPESTAGTGDGTCGTPCYYWIEFQVGNSFSMGDLKSIDERLDGSAGLDVGSVRIYETVGVIYIKAFNMLK